MANHEISLKWNGYQNNILLNVKELFQDEGLSDVTLVSQGQSYKAHKVILSANSSVFKSIFQQNPHKEPIIVLHDINTDALRTLLAFMYNGEVNVTEEFLPVLLKTAESLRICGLSTGSDCSSREEEKPLQPAAQQPKKRKKCLSEDSCSNNKKRPSSAKDKLEDVGSPNSVIPKVEPNESSLSDFSGENTNDTDIAILEECSEKKYNAGVDDYPRKPPTIVDSNEKNVKKWISEVSSTQPCLNASDKGNSLLAGNVECLDDEKDSVEIDKEIENVLQSGTIVESLSITTEHLNMTSSEAQSGKEKTTCYANPSFPCPFCTRVYNSWGYRRRHVKSRHMTTRLSCKWCVSVLPSTGAWYSHATRIHGVPHEEARNSLVVMVEAHAVLTLNEPSVAQLLGQVDISEAVPHQQADK